MNDQRQPPASRRLVNPSESGAEKTAQRRGMRLAALIDTAEVVETFAWLMKISGSVAGAAAPGALVALGDAGTGSSAVADYTRGVKAHIWRGKSACASEFWLKDPRAYVATERQIRLSEHSSGGDWESFREEEAKEAADVVVLSWKPDKERAADRLVENVKLGRAKRYLIVSETGDPAPTLLQGVDAYLLKLSRTPDRRRDFAQDRKQLIEGLLWVSDRMDAADVRALAKDYPFSDLWNLRRSARRYTKYAKRVRDADLGLAARGEAEGRLRLYRTIAWWPAAAVVLVVLGGAGARDLRVAEGVRRCAEPEGCSIETLKSSLHTVRQARQGGSPLQAAMLGWLGERDLAALESRLFAALKAQQYEWLRKAASGDSRKFLDPAVREQVANLLKAYLSDPPAGGDSAGFANFSAKGLQLQQKMALQVKVERTDGCPKAWCYLRVRYDDGKSVEELEIPEGDPGPWPLRVVTIVGPGVDGALRIGAQLWASPKKEHRDLSVVAFEHAPDEPVVKAPESVRATRKLIETPYVFTLGGFKISVSLHWDAEPLTLPERPPNR